MVVYEKVYLDAQINKEYICLKNTAKLDFILGIAGLHWYFFQST